ncbi:MAG TPA: Tat pathway signal sequence domain protein, partial [Opitutaceae bacterium]
MKPITRRNFIRTAAIATVATRIASRAGAAGQAPAAQPAILPSNPGAAPVRWLEGAPPAVNPGSTFGVSWPLGKHPTGTSFSLTAAGGAAVPVQSWPLAIWPDGSLKWTAHAIPADAPAAPHFEVAAGAPAVPAQSLTAVDGADAIEIDTGVIQCRVSKSGRVLVASLSRGGKPIAVNGRLVCKLEDRSEPGFTRTVPFEGALDKVSLESSGLVRAVVKLEGRHASADGSRAWLPFVVRLYFHAGAESVRVLHTIVFDGDERKDFIRGLGIRFDVPLRGALHDRHVRFSGQDEGLFGEAVRGLTGLRRDPGKPVRDAQFAGEATPALDTWPANVTERLQYIPAYDDWTLLQSTADGFDIRKRTKKGYTWLVAAQGERAGGLGYIGTPDGGLAFGIRNFWQSHPAQLDIRGATGDTAQVTAWVWAPGAAAMDLRSYHDGMGQDTYAKQYNGGLEITYEDYEPGFDVPEGVARTSEVFLFAVAATPTRARLAQFAGIVRTPPVLVATAEHLHACGVFGGMWAPADRSTPARARIEDQLAWQFDFYRDQQEQRRWYGYWNYGDVMHTYDSDRHEWRYDIGGFAWDNSELSTDIWLWLYFLSTGRADVFRFAEAMTRHTGEVDVHHIGRFSPLGSRHNVLHWGCSAKQLRISTALNRRYYYYLTGDERIGDLMREQVEAARTLLKIRPGRKLASAENPGDLDRATPPDPDRIGLSVGTDWGSIAGAWLTEWERTGSPLMRDRLMASMRTLGEQPNGFFTTGLTMNLTTGAYDIA